MLSIFYCSKIYCIIEWNEFYIL